MKWSKAKQSWERIPWPQIVRRIRAMYQVEALADLEIEEVWVEEMDLCTCGHDVEDHNDVWKQSTKCGKCDCKEWEASVENGRTEIRRKSEIAE